MSDNGEDGNSDSSLSEYSGLEDLYEAAGIPSPAPASTMVPPPTPTAPAALPTVVPVVCGIPGLSLLVAAPQVAAAAAAAAAPSQIPPPTPPAPVPPTSAPALASASAPAPAPAFAPAPAAAAAAPTPAPFGFSSPPPTRPLQPPIWLSNPSNYDTSGIPLEELVKLEHPPPPFREEAVNQYRNMLANLRRRHAQANREAANAAAAAKKRSERTAVEKIRRLLHKDMGTDLMPKGKGKKKDRGGITKQNRRTPHGVFLSKLGRMSLEDLASESELVRRRRTGDITQTVAGDVWTGGDVGGGMGGGINGGKKDDDEDDVVL